MGHTTAGMVLRGAFFATGKEMRAVVTVNGEAVKAAGMKVGVAVNPETPVHWLEHYINQVDMVLIMTVNPGFGGQKFIGNTINKVHRLRSLIAESGSKALIQIDGGVQAETAPLLVEAGADVLVSGSYIFGAKDPIETIHSLKTTGNR